ACSYHNASINFRNLEGEGVYIASKPTLSTQARSFGKVGFSKRAFYFGSCSSTAEAAIQGLHRAAIDRGGNILDNVEFQSGRPWSTNPQCLRNLTSVLLIIPMFLPIPQSVNVRGDAIYDPSVAYGDKESAPSRDDSQQATDRLSSP